MGATRLRTLPVFRTSSVSHSALHYTEASQPLPQSFPQSTSHWIQPLLPSQARLPNAPDRKEAKAEPPAVAWAQGSGPRPSAEPRPGRLLPPGYLELEGALGALDDLFVEALLGVVGQLERDLGGPRHAGRQRPQQQQGRQRPPGAPRRHRPARREASRGGGARAGRGCGAAGLRGCGRDAAWPRGRAAAPGRARALPERFRDGCPAGKGPGSGGRAAAVASPLSPVVSRLGPQCPLSAVPRR